MNKIRFAVVGCGNIALRYTIPAIMESEISEAVVCIDTNDAQEVVINERFGLPFERSLDSALNRYEFDAVYIATPISTHKDLVILAASNKKHILCEKSLACNLTEVEEIIHICRSNKVALLEGFMYQYHLQHLKVSELISSGEIGQAFLFKAWFGFPPLDVNNFRYSSKLGGGAILDAAAYTVHAARHFFKSEPSRVMSVLSSGDKDVEIQGSAFLDFGNGNAAHLAFGFNNKYRNEYSIWGSKGVISLKRAFALPPDFKPVISIDTQSGIENITIEACNHFIEQIKYFFTIINGELTNYENYYSDAINQCKVLDLIRINAEVKEND